MERLPQRAGRRAVGRVPVRVPAVGPALGHDDDQRVAARDRLGLAELRPGVVGPAAAVQEVEDRVAARALGVVAAREEDLDVRRLVERRRGEVEVGQPRAQAVLRLDPERLRDLGRGGRRARAVAIAAPAAGRQGEGRREQQARQRGPAHARHRRYTAGAAARRTAPGDGAPRRRSHPPRYVAGPQAALAVHHERRGAEVLAPHLGHERGGAPLGVGTGDAVAVEQERPEAPAHVAAVAVDGDPEHAAVGHRPARAERVVAGEVAERVRDEAALVDLDPAQHVRP